MIDRLIRMTAMQDRTAQTISSIRKSDIFVTSRATSLWAACVAPLPRTRGHLMANLQIPLIVIVLSLLTMSIEMFSCKNPLRQTVRTSISIITMATADYCCHASAIGLSSIYMY